MPRGAPPPLGRATVAAATEKPPTHTLTARGTPAPSPVDVDFMTSPNRGNEKHHGLACAGGVDDVHGPGVPIRGCAGSAVARAGSDLRQRPEDTDLARRYAARGGPLGPRGLAFVSRRRTRRGRFDKLPRGCRGDPQKSRDRCTDCDCTAQALPRLQPARRLYRRQHVTKRRAGSRRIEKSTRGKHAFGESWSGSGTSFGRVGSARF